VTTWHAEAPGPGTSLERRRADERLVRQLAADGFRGPRYEQFECALIRYGVGTLKGWMRTGYVFAVTASRGYRLAPSETELRAVREDDDLRNALAWMTVAIALPRFVDRALREGGWTVAGGAALTTYFMGYTVPVFANEFRHHRRERQQARRQDAAAALVEEHRPPAEDPAAIVAAHAQARQDLARLAPRVARIVELHVAGYEHDEIARRLPELTSRAVEGVLYRWRREERRRRAGGGSVA
jgi:DNA-directed RNA polymerase specialized sigma24 family protein